MLFTIDQPDFKNLLSVVTRASESRAVLPILGNILLEVKGGELFASGTNIQLTISTATSLSSFDAEDGSITLPASELMTLVNGLDENKPITVIVDNETWTATIRSGKSKTQMRGIGSQEFPYPRAYETKDSIQLPREAFVDAIERIIYVADPSATNNVYRGLALYFNGSELNLFGNNSFRFARSLVDIGVDAFDGTEVILPMRSLTEIRNLFGSGRDEFITMAMDFDENNEVKLVTFENDIVSLTSQVIEGTLYRNLDSLLPKVENSVIVNRNSLIRSLKKMMIFAVDSNNSAKFSFNSDSVYMIAQSQTRGSTEDEIDTQMTGEPIENETYNVKYFLDALGSFDTDTIKIDLRKTGEKYIMTVESEVYPGLISAMTPMATR